MIDGQGDLHPLVELTVKDIFRRLDKIIVNNSLEYPEFKEFYSRVNIQLNESDFAQKILKRFCNTQGSVNRRGFIEFFKDAIRTQGEATVWRWFEKWGYDKDLHCVEARTFMLTVHSMGKISIQIEETSSKKDYDELVNKMIIERFGEELESKGGVYRLLSKFSE